MRVSVSRLTSTHMPCQTYSKTLQTQWTLCLVATKVATGECSLLDCVDPRKRRMESTMKNSRDASSANCGQYCGHCPVGSALILLAEVGPATIIPGLGNNTNFRTHFQNICSRSRISTGRYFGERVKVAEALGGLQRYFHFYNYERVHPPLRNRTPAQVYGVALTHGTPWPSLTYFQPVRHFSFQRLCVPLCALGHSHRWHRSGA
jgi:hypothetical protein